MAVDLVRAEHISKTFSGVPALQDVRFDLRPKEVHALLGENGAGKSILLTELRNINTHDEETFQTYPGDVLKFVRQTGVAPQLAGIVPYMDDIAKTTRRNDDFKGIG
ncbi:MAG: ATP-binding cassette domain-containing protein [Treponema sp.]|jgi:ABC-type sugar transport system ATPase subunit|nr:ATP-binding cassette domain-containing protein [Treponema sp.]